MTNKSEKVEIDKKAVSPMSGHHGSEQLDFNVNIESRMGRAEGILESVVHEMGEIGKNQKELSNGMSLFREEVLAHISRVSAPKWPLIAGVLTLVLTIITMGGSIVGMIMSGQNANISRLDMIMQKQQEGEATNKFEDGQTVMWRKMVDKALVDLDDRLQREMRLINATTDSKITALDDKIQKEFYNTIKNHDERTIALQEQMKEFFRWRLEWATTRSGLSDKVSALEKYLDKIENRQFEIKTQVVSETSKNKKSD